jgi:Subtilase family
MTMIVPRRVRLFASVGWLLLLGVLPLAAADDGYAPPTNLGHGLREIVQWSHDANVTQLFGLARTAAFAEHIRDVQPRAQLDQSGRIVVDIVLNGTAPVANVRRDLAMLGLQSIAEHPATGRSGSAFGRISAWMSPEAATAAAAVPGVQSVLLVHQPWHRVGRVTSQGVGVLHADAVMALGFTGHGIRIGAISDSYNIANTTPNAAADVATDDLPGNATHPLPVVVLQEGATGQSNTDEGRAMLQIAHDMAPGAGLAFCAVGQTQVTFANAITNLRTNSSAPCDIIVDDIIFADEPMFSDGIVGQAAETAVTSTTLAGRPVVFYSAAGNDAGQGYEADWKPVADTTARGMGIPNLNLNQVPDTLTAGGFHNFAAAAGQNGVTIVQQVTLNLVGYPSGTKAEFNFQWNDLFIPNEITTDYYFLVFDTSGNFLTSVSGTDQATGFSGTGEAAQIVDLTAPLNAGTKTYQIVISRGTVGTTPASHFRYTVDPSAGVITGSFVSQTVPTIFGHSGARNVDAVGGYYYADTSAPESYSSLGPVSIYFDDAGNRLSTPELRWQPTISGVDGVVTTFFPSASSPNFFGTSAAGPHAAGVAALLLQAAGGPGSITPMQMRGLLESTAAPYSADPLIKANGFSPSAGFGLINAQTALTTLQNEALKTAPLTNISTRLLVQTGSNIGIAGFVITGSVAKQVLIRGIAPSLTALGVAGAMADPVLNVFDATSSTVPIATNNNWQDTQATAIQQTGMAPSNVLESAILVTLNPGAYTAQIQSATNGTGVARVDVIDLNPAPAVKLTNISTRGLVAGGANAMIAGFIIPPGESKSVLVRAIGPGLTQLGVPGAVADPNVTVYDQNGNQLAFNLHWADTQQAAIQATGQAPGTAHDSAILISLTPGEYTAIVRSNSGGTGVARVDVLDLDP